MIARIISKALTNQTNDQSTNQISQLIKPMSIDQSNHQLIKPIIDQKICLTRPNKGKTKFDGLVKPNAMRRLTKQLIKQIIEINYLIKPRIIANDWLNKYKNNDDYLSP